MKCENVFCNCFNKRQIAWLFVFVSRLLRIQKAGFAEPHLLHCFCTAIFGGMEISTLNLATACGQLGTTYQDLQTKNPCGFFSVNFIDKKAIDDNQRGQTKIPEKLKKKTPPHLFVRWWGDWTAQGLI